MDTRLPHCLTLSASIDLWRVPVWRHQIQICPLLHENFYESCVCTKPKTASRSPGSTDMVTIEGVSSARRRARVERCYLNAGCWHFEWVPVFWWVLVLKGHFIHIKVLRLSWMGSTVSQCVLCARRQPDVTGKPVTAPLTFISSSDRSCTLWRTSARGDNSVQSLYGAAHVHTILSWKERKFFENSL